MTDIYVRHFKGRRSRRGPFLLISGLILAAAVGITVWHLRQNAAVPSAVEPPSPAPEAATAPLSGGPAPEAPAPVTPPTPAATSSGPAPDTSPETMNTLRQALRLIEQDRLLEARKTLFILLEQNPSGPVATEIRKRLGEVNTKLALSPRAMPEKEAYVIQKGDIIWNLARKFNTTADYLQEANQIKGGNIRPGDRILYLTGNFALVVDKARFTLTLYLNGRFFKEYRIATGSHGKTPAGTFKITDRIYRPDWYSPSGLIPYGDPRNILGTHWLKLESTDGQNHIGYGIHGTTDPASIGAEASAGCVRMLNEEVRELFILVPLGTPVSITE